MTDTRAAPYTLSTAFPTYAWTLENGVVRLEGPLSRPVARRRALDLPLPGLPESLRVALQSDGGAPSRPFAVGRRVVQIIVTQPGAGVLLHVTRLHRWEHRVTTYLNWLEEGINALSEAFVLYDADDRLLIANPQYAELYPTIADVLRVGVTFSEITETALRRGQFRYGEDADAWLNRRLEFHRRGEGFFEQHLDNGRWIQLSERRTRSGGVTSIRADITLLKEREEALSSAKQHAERTSESMARFLAMFSHEVSNGLNGLAGLAQTLALDAESPSQRTNTQLMLQSTKRLTTVLSDLLDYLKNEAVGVAIRLRATAPRDLLDTLKAELEPRATQGRVLLKGFISKQVPEWVEIDPGRVLQVLVNLTGNALKYTESGGAIAVRITTQGRRLHFEVRDQGAGIEPEDVGRLFEYFSQTSAQKPASSGIGLAICKQLVTAMGGDIGVDTEPGRGSTFWFNVPLHVGAPAPAHGEKPVARADAALRVGVVDDDPLNLTVAHALLVRSGYEAMVLDDAQDIVRAVKDRGLDVLLLDLMMPKASGFEIAARLRAQADPVFSRLIVIALTGNIISDNLSACKTAGIDAVLQKPLYIEQLQYALTWAASFDRTARAQAPFVFSPIVLTAVDDSGRGHAESALRQLEQDIGGTRFRQSVRSARDLFAQAARLASDDLAALRGYAHRVAGTASQMGFHRLSDHARTVEALLASSSGPDAQGEDMHRELDKLRSAAADSLPVLEQAMRGKFGAAIQS
ncbi:ATP-binding protein [Castellaniella sp. GW247-6E4]|uniref:ATP-binding protein n=1 Tax=Castellaniella sp. GW247-6E4 TaxID=3140380 RepID=UPI0033145E97